MNTITVLTPTYNRKELLPILFTSLCKQTDKDFIWMIIDDGSTDETGNLIDELKKVADFSIEYRKKQNGGKHTALNYAYQFIVTPLIFIVDSDDKLTDNAIFSIKEIFYEYSNESDLCGFSFLRGKTNGGYLSDSDLPKDGLKESYVECRINRGIGGDMAEVWYTKCLKEFPFPEFKGEKFLGEDVVWIRMAEKYKMRFFNTVIYISDYREDGLTSNRRKYNIASPNGCVLRAETFLYSKANLKVKLKAMLQYQIYGKFAGIGTRDQYKRSHNKVLYGMLMLPSRILFIKWNKESQHNKIQ